MLTFWAGTTRSMTSSPTSAAGTTGKLEQSLEYPHEKAMEDLFRREWLRLHVSEYRGKLNVLQKKLARSEMFRKQGLI